MAVLKATVTMTVFFRDEDADRFKAATLDEILYEVDEGDWIGSAIEKSEPNLVPNEALEGELKAIGNDGSFFDESDIDALEGNTP